jgi:hypothetical protein
VIFKKSKKFVVTIADIVELRILPEKKLAPAGLLRIAITRNRCMLPKNTSAT